MLELKVEVKNEINSQFRDDHGKFQMHITENATGGSAIKQLKVCFAIACGGG